MEDGATGRQDFEVEKEGMHIKNKRLEAEFKSPGLIECLFEFWIHYVSYWYLILAGKSHFNFTIASSFNEVVSHHRSQRAISSHQQEERIKA
jgi:hypothetical protein